MALFGGNPIQNRPRNLLEFKAGRMNYRTPQNMVYPDKRKGLVYIHQGPDLSMHFCWKDRSSNSNTPEEDVIIVPNDFQFKRVTQNTTGRVYLLKFNSNKKKYFYWMQEPKEDKDDEICRKVNELLNVTSRMVNTGQSGGASAGLGMQSLFQQFAGSGGSLNPNDLATMLQGMNQNDWMTLFGSGPGSGSVLGSNSIRAGTSTQRTGTPTRAGRTGRQTADSRPNTAPATTRTVPSGPSSQRQTNNVSATSSKPKSNLIEMTALTNVLTNLTSTAQPTTSDSIRKPENFVEILSNKDFQEKLRPKLPSDWSLPTDQAQCRTMIDSPQFKQALEAFSSLVESRQLGSALDQFGFPNQLIETAQSGDMNLFAQALESYYKSKNEESTDKTMETN